MSGDYEYNLVCDSCGDDSQYWNTGVEYEHGEDMDETCEACHEGSLCIHNPDDAEETEEAED